MKATEPGYDAGKFWADQGQLEKAILWRRAYMLYCEGLGLAEIERATGLTYASLRSKSQPTGDDWPSARQQMILARVDSKLPMVPAIENMEHQIKRIKENREQNLAAAVELRDTLMDIVTRLNAGTLTMEKLFHHKGTVTKVEHRPTTGDLVNIATFARIIADLTYRALGDQTADSKADPGASPATTSAPPGITVILPAIAVEPRPRRGPKRATVVDIEATPAPGGVPPVDIETTPVANPPAPNSSQEPGPQEPSKND